MQRFYHCGQSLPLWDIFTTVEQLCHSAAFLSLWTIFTTVEQRCHCGMFFTTAERLYRGASLPLWNINYYVVLWNIMRKVERLSHCGVFFTIVDDHSCIFLFPKSMETKTGPDKSCMASEMYEAPSIGYDRPRPVLSGRWLMESSRRICVESLCLAQKNFKWRSKIVLCFGLADIAVRVSPLSAFCHWLPTSTRIDRFGLAYSV